MMSILVISSCTKLKFFDSLNMPNCSHIKSKSDREKIVEKIPHSSCKAVDMYLGPQHINIVKGIRSFRNIAHIDFFILSAGFGLLPEHEIIPVYECSFSSLSRREIFERATLLEIPQDFKKLLQKRYDLIYLALGSDYLTALGEWDTLITDLTLTFFPSKNDSIITLKANNAMVSTFSALGYTIHGAVGFKGDFFRIFSEIILRDNNPSDKLSQVLQSKDSLEDFLKFELLQPNRNTLDIFLNK